MSEFKQLYIFVEGSDDQRMFEQVFRPKFESDYDSVLIIPYASLPAKALKAQIQAIASRKNTDYIFVCDLDSQGDSSFCITKRKNKQQEKMGGTLPADKILVVKEEIESWYLAGITSDNLAKFSIKPFQDTENIGKERFMKLIPKQFMSKTDFMVEILKEYDLNVGRKQNSSLNYFVMKYSL